jgi:hypothetical protein
MLMAMFERIIQDLPNNYLFLVKYILFPWLIIKMGIFGEFTMIYLTCLIHATFLSFDYVDQSTLSIFFSKRKIALYCFLGFTVSMMFFVKVSFLPFIALIPFILIVQSIVARRFVHLIYFMLSASVTFVAVYLSFRLDIRSYLINSVEIINGYKKAMQIVGWNDYSRDVFISVVLILVFFFQLFRYNTFLFLKKSWPLLILLLVTAYFFHSYSFTRGFSGGVVFNYPFLIFIVMIGIYLQDRLDIKTNLITLVVIILLISIVDFSYSDFKALILPKKQVSFSKLPAQYIDDSKTYDVYPTLAGICYFNKLSYKPRPIIQAYSSYTTKLDSIDASFFSAKKVDFIIFSGASNNCNSINLYLNSIDNRYFMFDEPLSKLAILNNYKIKRQINDSLFIASTQDSGFATQFKLVSNKLVKLGELIDIKDLNKNDLYFFTAKIKYTPEDQLLSLAKRYPFVRVKMVLETGKNITFNAVPELLRNPSILNKYCDNYNDMFRLRTSELAGLKSLKSISIISCPKGSFEPTFEFNVYHAVTNR